MKLDTGKEKGETDLIIQKEKFCRQKEGSNGSTAPGAERDSKKKN